MSDISGSGTLQFWQGIAAVIGASLGGFFLAIGRRSGTSASRAAETNPTGDALQREILLELRGLRTDWQAKREADEERRRDRRERSIDDQIEDLRRGQTISRAGQNDIKDLLGVLVRRQPPAEPRRLPAPDDRGSGAAEEG